MNDPIGNRFLQDESGAVAATYAMALTALIVIAGVGFDYGRLATMDSELQNGADQAALAGATQLDGKSDARADATAAASNLVTNTTILSNSGNSSTITVASVTFWQDKERTQAATSDADARFIDVAVTARTIDYAFTPIIGLFTSPLISAGAMAGLGSSVCKVPPMMICSPDPANPFDAANKVGWGLQASGHGNGRGGANGTVSAWGPGDFGFLEVGAGQNSDLVKALAFKQIPFDCTPVDGTLPETGNPQALYDAVNTRFDIYDFSSGNGTTLAPCFSGSCPSAANTVKDVVKQNTNTNGNACKLQNSGWHLPPTNRQFWPRDAANGTNGDGSYNNTALSPSIDAMGLPRDLCHYGSFNTACTGGVGGRFGNGAWARVDYFNKNHPLGERPPSPGTVTRYQTYRWEIDQSLIPHNLNAGSDKQYGQPICSTGTADGIDRRVLTVAVVKNCSSLSGGSTKVVVDEWVDVFLVEPVVDARGNGAVADSIYMEIIGPSRLAGGGSTAAQLIRRDVPYLVR